MQTETGIFTGERGRFIYAPAVAEALDAQLFTPVEYGDDQQWGYQPDPYNRQHWTVLVGKNPRTALEAAGLNADEVLKQNVHIWPID